MRERRRENDGKGRIRIQKYINTPHGVAISKKNKI